MYLPESQYLNFRLLLPAILIFILTVPAHAQQVQLRGIITDADNGQPVEGANVVLLDENDVFYRGAATYRNGLFRIGSILPGTYTLRISYVGYLTREESIEITDEPSQNFNARIAEDSGMLDEVVITVRGGTPSENLSLIDCLTIV